ncbi:hypothetical protein Tco_1178025, partial [Tanacetum coccineum]
MVLGKPFAKQYKITYGKEEGTIMFKKNDEKVTFKMPHKMKRFKDIEDLNTDSILPFFIASKGHEEKEKVMLDEETFGKHFEEKHMTWAQFEKKIDKDTTLGLSVREDGIRICCDAVNSEGRRRHFIGECLKSKENKAFIGAAWSDREEGVEPQKDAKCLMAINSQE